jgi:beta-lactam-binding protein with PASTA domain
MKPAALSLTLVLLVSCTSNSVPTSKPPSSAGPPTASVVPSGEVRVPHLVGSLAYVADRAAQRLGLRLEVRTLPPTALTRRPRVIAQSPPAGSLVKIGSVLHITARCPPLPCPSPPPGQTPNPTPARIVDPCTCFIA